MLYEIERRLPADFHEWEDVTYVEPFVGSGSVLFHMLKLHPNITHAVINDINKVLMASYEAIRDNPDEVYGSLELLENEYNSLNPSRQNLISIICVETISMGIKKAYQDSQLPFSSFSTIPVSMVYIVKMLGAFSMFLMGNTRK